MKFALIFTNTKIKNLLLAFFILLIAGCETRHTTYYQETENPEEDGNFVIIISEGMDFSAPDSIPSGWNHFRHVNNSDSTHFFVLEKMPKGKTLANSKEEIVPIFSDAMNKINVGEKEAGFKTFEKLPEWYFDIVFTGGSGLVSPRTFAENTFYLEPGYYVMECYVKMPDGQFHSAMGMIEKIVVTEEQSNIEEPEATFNIKISSEDGFVMEGIPSAGDQTIAVTFVDQIAHENFVGHDLHLVKLDPEADISVLENWIDWANPDGFKSPTPEGFYFMGGTQEMPAGKTAYFHTTLMPGNYVFIAEVPNASQKNMLKTFTIE